MNTRNPTATSTFIFSNNFDIVIFLLVLSFHLKSCAQQLCLFLSDWSLNDQGNMYIGDILSYVTRETDKINLMKL